MSNRCCGSCTRFPSHHSLHKRTALHVTRRGHRKRRSHRHVYYIYIIGSAAFLKKRRYQSFHSSVLLLSYSSVHPSFQSCMHLFHCLICLGRGVFPLRSRSTVPHRQCSLWQNSIFIFTWLLVFTDQIPETEIMFRGARGTSDVQVFRRARGTSDVQRNKQGK